MEGILLAVGSRTGTFENGIWQRLRGLSDLRGINENFPELGRTRIGNRSLKRVGSLWLVLVQSAYETRRKHRLLSSR